MLIRLYADMLKWELVTSLSHFFVDVKIVFGTIVKCQVSRTVFGRKVFTLMELSHGKVIHGSCLELAPSVEHQLVGTQQGI